MHLQERLWCCRPVVDGPFLPAVEFIQRAIDTLHRALCSTLHACHAHHEGEEVQINLQELSHNPAHAATANLVHVFQAGLRRLRIDRDLLMLHLNLLVQLCSTSNAAPPSSHSPSASARSSAVMFFVRS